MCLQDTPAEAARAGGSEEDSHAQYWAAAYPTPQAPLPPWLASGLNKLASLPVREARQRCQEAQSVVLQLEPELRRGGVVYPSNGTLIVFEAPAPHHGQSQDLYEAPSRDGDHGAGEGRCVYVMLQASRPLRWLDQVRSPVPPCSMSSATSGCVCA